MEEEEEGGAVLMYVHRALYEPGGIRSIVIGEILDTVGSVVFVEIYGRGSIPLAHWRFRSKSLLDLARCRAYPSGSSPGVTFDEALEEIRWAGGTAHKAWLTRWNADT